MRAIEGTSHGIARRMFLALLVVAVAGCTHKPGADEERVPPPEPILVHVRNENFLDMNVYVVLNSVSRRLGTVPGNSQADFRIAWAMYGGMPFAITGVPIGGSGYATTGQLNIGPDQMVEFRIGMNLRQSTVSVQDRP